MTVASVADFNVNDIALEAQLPIYIYIHIYRVPVLKSLYKSILSITQGPTIWVPGLLGLHINKHGAATEVASAAKMPRKRHSWQVLVLGPAAAKPTVPSPPAHERYNDNLKMLRVSQ